MIKIIKGTYGHMPDPKSGRVYPKTSKDKPFSLTPEQEERLVSLKVAKYVDGPEPDTAPGAPDTGAGAPPATGNDTEPGGQKMAQGGADGLRDGDNAEASPVELDDMSAKELREYGKELGLTLKVGLTKAEMREQIEEALASLTDDGGDDEEPPKFDAAEAVL